ncbi:unnamed protein product [Toxocara canis]|uniref:7TM_GPCR_Srx domain-containing protein n=1 Tax=Toxocara canis TaxID=6265 RepID=A0A183VDS2_TOXCA|nr:unnamed protein product [Toxocara canis]
MENSSNVPRAIMASFVILTVPFSLCLYIVVMKQLYCNRTFRKKSAYRMMIVIGLFDCIQLSVHLCLAILEVIYLFGHLDDSAYENSVHIKILGAFLNGAWFPMTIIKLLLAFDQFLAIVFPTVEDVLFTATNVRITVILLWSCFVAMTVLHLTPYATFKYNPKMLLWSYDGRSALGFVLEYIDRAFSSTVVVSSLLFYLTITVNTLQTNFSFVLPSRKENPKSASFHRPFDPLQRSYLPYDLPKGERERDAAPFATKVELPVYLEERIHAM